MRYVVKRAHDGLHWLWHVQAANGEILASSELYERKESAVDAAELLADLDDDVTINDG